MHGAVAVHREQALLLAQHGERGVRDLPSAEARLVQLLCLRAVLDEPAPPEQSHLSS